MVAERSCYRPVSTYTSTVTCRGIRAVTSRGVIEQAVLGVTVGRGPKWSVLRRWRSMMTRTAGKRLDGDAAAVSSYRGWP